MKYIKDGKIYNTDTATHIGNRYTPVSRGDFRWLSEDLYQTPKGIWFLVGEGGAMTKYAHHCSDGSSCGGDGMFVLSTREALAWCEAHIDSSETEKLFDLEEA